MIHFKKFADEALDDDQQLIVDDFEIVVDVPVL